MTHDKSKLLEDINEVNHAVKLIQNSINKVNGDLSLLSREEIDYLTILYGNMSCGMYNVSSIVEEDMMLDIVPGINGPQLLCDWMMWIVLTEGQITRILRQYCL